MIANGLENMKKELRQPLSETDLSQAGINEPETSSHQDNVNEVDTLSRRVEEMKAELKRQLIEQQMPDGMWRGRLSSSAISTSVAIFALQKVDASKYSREINRGAKWLHETMLSDGSWGDSPESPANMTATLLSYAALFACDSPPQKSIDYLREKFGGTSDQHIIDGVIEYYGSDLTFSAPILVMCASAGVINSWKNIPQLPFELATLPQKLFRFLKLPVVSYAIPALIAVGILRYKHGRGSWLRNRFIPKSLIVLENLQPPHGGFLEAAPLTAFVTMCMCGAGYSDHAVVKRGAGFLVDTVREDGSWPIDTDLSCWVTSLSIKALQLSNNEKLAETIKSNAFKEKHYFTGARAGGWGWTDLQGSAPDADDTAGALIALHTLMNGKPCGEVEQGIEWLLSLQNSDGGIPTFCKGWGKLPFDRSSPDISAHALLAFELWIDKLPETLQTRTRKGIKRIVKWLDKTQDQDGSWIPLWFGDQDADNEQSPVYGTAVAVEHLTQCREPMAKKMVEKGRKFLLNSQNADGGFGAGGKSKVTLTAAALSAMPDNEKAFEFLYRKFKEGEINRAEPIGLYFARLWYSEKLYNITFTLKAINKIQIK